MNTKTVARAVKKLGLSLVIYKDAELTIYCLQDKDGNDIAYSNKARYLFDNLPYIIEDIHTQEAEALAERFLR